MKADLKIKKKINMKKVNCHLGEVDRENLKEISCFNKVFKQLCKTVDKQADSIFTEEDLLYAIRESANIAFYLEEKTLFKIWDKGIIDRWYRCFSLKELFKMKDDTVHFFIYSVVYEVLVEVAHAECEVGDGWGKKSEETVSKALRAGMSGRKKMRDEQKDILDNSVFSLKPLKKTVFKNFESKPSKNKNKTKKQNKPKSQSKTKKDDYLL